MQTLLALGAEISSLIGVTRDSLLVTQQQQRENRDRSLKSCYKPLLVCGSLSLWVVITLNYGEHFDLELLWAWFPPRQQQCSVCIVCAVCGHNVVYPLIQWGTGKIHLAHFSPAGGGSGVLVMVEAETAGIKTPWSGASWRGARAATRDQLITRAKWPSPATPAPTARDQLLHLLQRGGGLELVFNGFSD